MTRVEAEVQYARLVAIRPYMKAGDTDKAEMDTLKKLLQEALDRISKLEQKAE